MESLSLRHKKNLHDPLKDHAGDGGKVEEVGGLLLGVLPANETGEQHDDCDGELESKPEYEYPD